MKKKKKTSLPLSICQTPVLSHGCCFMSSLKDNPFYAMRESIMPVLNAVHGSSMSFMGSCVHSKTLL